MGVSPVIATLLLILIAVAAAVLVYLWVTGYVGTATRAQPEMEERIKVEAVSVSDTTVKCYVRNVGGVTATVAHAYIETRGVVITSSGEISSSIPPGSSTTIPISGSLSSGIYTVRVVTKTGVEASYTFKVAP